eukprot:95981-Pyramimonas_sp.AAC.1
MAWPSAVSHLRSMGSAQRARHVRGPMKQSSYTFYNTVGIQSLLRDGTSQVTGATARASNGFSQTTLFQGRFEGTSGVKLQ